MKLNLRLQAADWVWRSIFLTTHLCYLCWWSWCRPHLVCSPPGQIENWKIGIRPPPAPGVDLVWELSRMRNIVTRVLDMGDTSVYHKTARHSPDIKYLNGLTWASPINMLIVEPMQMFVSTTSSHSHDCRTTLVPLIYLFSASKSGGIFSSFFRNVFIK